MRCRSCNNTFNNYSSSVEDEDLCNTCIGLSFPSKEKEKTTAADKQEEESGFRVDWY